MRVMRSTKARRLGLSSSMNVLIVIPSRVTRKGITINTFMLDDSPELMRFVEAMTRINKGRAFYTTPGQIGEYVMVDYLSRKRRKIR